MSHNEISINLDSLLINRINKTDNCYCCREKTTSVSPCICKTAICDSCLLTYVKYNDKCTICNSQLQIYIPSPTSTRGSLSPMTIHHYHIHYHLKMIHQKLILCLFLKFC